MRKIAYNGTAIAQRAIDCEGSAPQTFDLDLGGDLSCHMASDETEQQVIPWNDTVRQSGVMSRQPAIRVLRDRLATTRGRVRCWALMPRAIPFARDAMPKLG